MSKDLEQENAQLKQQLAEKEKLIKQLGEANKFLSSDKAVSTEQVKQIAREAQLKVMKENIEIIYSTIRHEICEKIRNLIPECSGMKMIIMLDETISLNELLDQIEKGEE